MPQIANLAMIGAFVCSMTLAFSTRKLIVSIFLTTALPVMFILFFPHWGTITEEVGAWLFFMSVIVFVVYIGISIAGAIVGIELAKRFYKPSRAIIAGATIGIVLLTVCFILVLNR